MRELKISAIREGTVIDHIPAKNVFKVTEILGLEYHENVVSVATNLKSKKMDKKGIIKIGGRSLSQDELNKIAVLAPNATVSIIKNYNVVKKFKLKLQKTINKLVECSNPKCITNLEKVPTKFTVLRERPIRIRCVHCERIMEEGEIKIK